jgi:kynurenine formamidase
MKARLRIEGRELAVELRRPASLAIETVFSARGPSHFGAPAPVSQPLAVEGFSGEVRTGASCNCRTITLTPHCNGTHTECVGHLVEEPLDAHRVAPTDLLPARLVSVEPEPARQGSETADVATEAGDRIVTRRLLEAAWPRQGPFTPLALVVRTLPNSEEKRTRDYTNHVPAYFAREAAQLLVERGIEHVVLDLPSLDRTHDQGRLAAHRVFFGLDPGVRSLAAAKRRQCTITELAFVPDAIEDGRYLLQLQLPAIAGDAVPSRPLLYSVQSA